MIPTGKTEVLGETPVQMPFCSPPLAITEQWSQ